jgi:hypothetical protein
VAAADCWAARGDEGEEGDVEGVEGEEDIVEGDLAGPSSDAATAVLRGVHTAETVAKDVSDLLSISLLLAGSTRRLKRRRKSTPMMGNFTAASRKIQLKS